MQNKKLISIVGIFLVITIAVCVTVPIIAGSINKDKSPIRQTEWKEQTKVIYEGPAEKNRKNYYVVTADKETISQMSEGDFIEYISKVLRKGEGLSYTSIDFEDGTGIMWPASDIQNTAVYGEIGAEGIVSKPLVSISISGARVSYSESEYEGSYYNDELLEELPVELTSDSLSLYAKENEDGVFDVEISTAELATASYFMESVQEAVSSVLPGDFRIKLIYGTSIYYFDGASWELRYAGNTTEMGAIDE